MQNFMKSDIWRKYGGAIICVAIGILILLVLLPVKLYSERKISKLQGQLTVLQSENAQQAVTQSPVLDVAGNNARKELNGMDEARKIQDDKIMSDVFRYIATWKGGAGYADSRQKLLKKYDWLTEETPFIQEFFPDASSLILTDTSGQVIQSYLDDKNIQFLSLETHVNAVQADVYSYVGIVLTQSSGPVGGTATGTIFVTYDMYADGHAENIHAFTIAY